MARLHFFGSFIQLRLALAWAIQNLGQSDLGKLLRIPVRTKPSLYIIFEEKLKN